MSLEVNISLEDALNAGWADNGRLFYAGRAGIKSL